MISRADDLLKGMTIEADYTGPRLEEQPEKNGKKPRRITQKYIDGMRSWFKSGKIIARRDAWEIVLGAQLALSREPSLVEVTIPENEVADIVGDTHGQYFE